MSVASARYRSYQSHQFQNMCTVPTLILFTMDWFSCGPLCVLQMRFAYDGLTIWRAHWILCLVIVECVCFFYCIHQNQFIFTIIHIGWECAMPGFYLIFWIILHFDNGTKQTVIPIFVSLSPHSHSLTWFMNALIAKAKSLLAFKQITYNIVARSIYIAIAEPILNIVQKHHSFRSECACECLNVDCVWVCFCICICVCVFVFVSFTLNIIVICWQRLTNIGHNAIAYIHKERERVYSK